MKTGINLIEPLESRIAPATVSFAYTDFNGDHVTIHASNVPSGTIFNSSNLTLSNGATGTLEELNLAAPAFNGADISFTVKPVAGSNGQVNVGYIDAGTNHLGTVAVNGDLGRISAGNGSGTAVKALSVNSLGKQGLTSQGGPGGLSGTASLVSDINGALDSLKVTTDDTGTFVNVTHSGIVAINIGGSLIGGSNGNSGEISSSGNMGSVKIGGNVQGGGGSGSGQLNSGGTISSITIGGSLEGGAGSSSGAITSAGNLGTVKVRQNVQGSAGPSSGSIESYGTIGAITIGQSLIGGSNDDTGYIGSNGNMGAITIGHDIQGGVGLESGKIYSGGTVSVTVDGSVIGGSGTSSGGIVSNGNMGPVKIDGSLTGYSGSVSNLRQSGFVISNGNIAAVTIGGSVVGGSDIASGFISSAGAIGAVKIGGSLTGGTNTDSGFIESNGNMGAVKIGGNLAGGSISGSMPGVDFSGVIESTGNIAGVTIGGSIVSGTDTSNNGSLSNNASIRADGEIVSLTVRGSIIGNPAGGAGNVASPVGISAGGLQTLASSATTDPAFGKINVGGRVQDAEILAGYSFGFGATLYPVNGSAQIGAVKVGGDWIASDLVAGATDSYTPAGAPLPNFGTIFDAAIGSTTMGIMSKIASITIAGHVSGSSNPLDNYGFVADAIGSMKIAGSTITIPAPNSTPVNVGGTTDVDIHVL